MHRTAVINVVGLTPKLLSHMPRLRAFGGAGSVAGIGHVAPAVTCSVQATYLTGVMPAEHGIVGNGWYDRDECEIKFWKQSDKLVQRPRIWNLARQRDSRFTCANLFWWYAMYSSAESTVTPRPQYRADGRKIPDIWTHPPELRDSLQQKFGQFPLFNFWGPAADIRSTQWIANAAGELLGRHDLTLIYLPHLDYALQQFGPDGPEAIAAAAEVDEVVGSLLTRAEQAGQRVIVLSEYGIEAASRPVHLNRTLRQHNLLTLRTEGEHELLDAGASSAFAVADHQIAHVYVNDSSKLDEVAAVVASTEGVETVLRGESKRAAGLDHPRAGDLVAVAERGAWFTYYFWHDDRRAPDYARTVDIHRKPGYDPAELFLDPSLPLVKARLAWKLLKKKLGFRSLLDVIPLDASLIKGSHGRPPSSRDQGPVLLSNQPGLIEGDSIPATAVCDLILRHLFE